MSMYTMWLSGTLISVATSMRKRTTMTRMAENVRYSFLSRPWAIFWLTCLGMNLAANL